jgi:trigger factor
MNEVLPGGKTFTVSVQENGQCGRILNLRIHDEAFQAEKSRVTDKLRRELNVPGFRKGKVPVGYIRKNYADLVHSEAVQNLLPEVYHQAVHSENLLPLTDPRFEKLTAKDGDGVSVEAHIEVKPEIRLTGYTGVSVTVERREIGDTDVEETLQGLRKHMATYSTVARPAQGDDLVVIDYAPVLESGETDEAARRRDYGVNLTSETLLPEFREGLAGLAGGGEKDISVQYPAEFPDAALAGKEKKFRVVVKEVKERLLPELDDAFAKNVAPNVESMEALRKRIREDLEKEEQSRYRQRVQESVIDNIIRNNEFEVPTAMVENYLTSLLEEDRRRRPQVDDESEREREIREMFHDVAVRGIKKFLIMEAVQKQENLTVSDSEIDQKVESLARDSGRPVEDVRKFLRDPARRRTLGNDLLDEKVLDFLRDHADIRVA